MANFLNVMFNTDLTGAKFSDYLVTVPLLTFLGCLLANSVADTRGRGIAPRIADAALCTTAITLVLLLVIWFF